MLKSGIYNPAMNHLLSRFRHTNTIVIADRDFPFWPQVETIDLALTDDIPRVTDVLRVLLPALHLGKLRMASEFRTVNSAATVELFQSLAGAVPIEFEPHAEFKLRVPGAVGLIRTADSVPYANIILESA